MEDLCGVKWVSLQQPGDRLPHFFPPRGIEVQEQRAPCVNSAGFHNRELVQAGIVRLNFEAYSKY